MSFVKINNVSIRGVAACVPKRAESNLDYDRLTEKERLKLIKTTGIEYRRIADENTTASDLSFESARKLVEALAWEPNEIDLLINVTQTPDYLIPSTAIILQNRLGLSTNCLAFDINLGCSGYVYGLNVISKMLDGNNINKVLLLAGDKSSHPVNYKDKSTYPLFGDAGSATALEFEQNAKPMFFKLNSDGSGYETIIVRSGGLRAPISIENLEVKQVSEGIERAANELELNGLDVFSFATTKVPIQIKELLTYSKADIENIDFFIFHQANKLMNELIRKKIKVPSEKVPYSLKDFGNTSSASIPLTMVIGNGNHYANNLNWLLSGFGVGLSWASVIAETQNLICPDLIEL